MTPHLAPPAAPPCMSIGAFVRLCDEALAEVERQADTAASLHGLGWIGDELERLRTGALAGTLPLSRTGHGVAFYQALDSEPFPNRRRLARALDAVSAAYERLDDALLAGLPTRQRELVTLCLRADGQVVDLQRPLLRRAPYDPDAARLYERLGGLRESLRRLAESARRADAEGLGTAPLRRDLEATVPGLAGLGPEARSPLADLRTTVEQLDCHRAQLLPAG